MTSQLIVEALTSTGTVIQGSQIVLNVSGDPGPQGPPGVGMNWRGAWSNVTAYAQGDAVSYQGGSFLLVAGSSTGQAPPSFPSPLSTDPEC